MSVKLRVCWIPQVPMEPFYVDVSSVFDAARIMNILADYDLFQYKKKVKPDCCNFGVLELLDESGEWVGWEDEEPGISDPVEYIEYCKDIKNA